MPGMRAHSTTVCRLCLLALVPFSFFLANKKEPIQRHARRQVPIFFPILVSIQIQQKKRKDETDHQRTQITETQCGPPRKEISRERIDAAK